jgi:hypothetical protein
MRRSFRFIDDDLNRRLIARLAKSGARHSVDKHGVIHYSSDDVELVENEVISSIRSEVFPSWQVLTCPEECAGPYKAYMTEHGIPFSEELEDDRRWFLIPGKYRPFAWKLDGPGGRCAGRAAR